MEVAAVRRRQIPPPPCLLGTLPRLLWPQPPAAMTGCTENPPDFCEFRVNNISAFSNRSDYINKQVIFAHTTVIYF
jgi:hypothetical protein